MPSMDLRIDRNSPVPLYRQVAAGIEAAIHDGRLVRANGWRANSPSRQRCGIHGQRCARQWMI